jgi:4-diphosphocytidyl-2-C-methyl-D-erythritol kinase
VGDVVEAEESDALSLAIESDLFAGQLAADESNLVLRAARALAAASGAPARARLTLEKNLPIASGLGGGSSDAAAALKALNQIWGLNWSNARLAEVGRGLGADVPVFFTQAGAALMSGAGEICAPLPLPQLPAVLVNPLAPLATADVYRRFDRMGLGSPLPPPPHWKDEHEAIAGMAALGNDLEVPARALMPQIAAIIADLRAAPTVRHAALSGSGATVFALMRDWEAAESLADLMRERYRDWWIVETMLGA